MPTPILFLAKFHGGVCDGEVIERAEGLAAEMTNVLDGMCGAEQYKKVGESCSLSASGRPTVIFEYALVGVHMLTNLKQ